MKLFFCLLLAICVSFPLFSIGYWGEGISFSAGYFSSAAIRFPAEASFSFRRDFDGVFAEAGCSVNDFAFDAAGSVQVTPLETPHIRLSVRNLLHLGKYINYNGWETDYQCLGIFGVRGGKTHNTFEFRAGGGVDYKHTMLYGGLFASSSDIKLKDLFAVVFLDFRKRFFDRHEIYMRLSSFDEYYYPIFFCPQYSLGYAYDVSDKFTLGAIGAVRYTDQCTLTGVIDGFQARIFASYRW